MEKQILSCNKKCKRNQYFTETPIAFIEKMKDPFTLQLHVTEKCNLRCTHCYNESWEKELSFDDFKARINQFQKILRITGVRGTVYLTGGEPTLWSHLLNAVRYLIKNRIVPRLLTNGTLISPILSRQLKKAGMKFVQVSLDGLKENHDHIRGEGNFDKAIQGIRNLVQVGIEVTVMFTAMKRNLEDIHKLIDIVEGLKVSRVCFSRFVPIGAGKGLEGEFLSSTEVYSFFRKLNGYKSGLKLVKRDPLWCILEKTCVTFSGCSTGQFLLDILVDGTVLPCRRLPIPIGNINETRLLAIWLQSTVLQEMRNRSFLDCKECRYVLVCGGGCRGITYAMTGDYNKKDPQCFVSNLV